MNTQTRNEPSDRSLVNHRAMLEERVFQVKTRWPHFRLLLDDVERLSAALPAGARVVSLERTLLYGGISLFAPFFARQEFISVDCSPGSADGRGAYNASMVDDPRTIRIPFTRRGRETQTGIADGWADLVMVPNLVHHVPDQDHLFTELGRITRRGGTVYVFEPLLRELHQVPDDYLRYTPFGMRNVLTAHGLDVRDVRCEGGPFQAIAYCWEQALQYFPDAEREEMQHWFFETEFPRLMAWDAQHTDNRVRKNTTFPVAFSIVATKSA